MKRKTVVALLAASMILSMAMPAAASDSTEETTEVTTEAATEAAPYQREQIDEQEATGVETLKENGMEVNDVDKTPFKEATAPIYDEYVKEGTGCVSPEIYQQVQEIIAQHPAQ